MFDRVTVK